MSDFSVISSVSNEILKLLREKICPELIQSPESVKLVSPSEKNADFQLGLYLYDIQELREFQQTDKIRISAQQARYPSKPLNLFYLLYVNGKSQMMSNMDNELRIVGRIIQVLMDHPMLPGKPAEGENQDKIEITLLNPNFEDKTKIWAALNVPYQIAVYFSVAAVQLSSEKMYSFTRVLETDYKVEHKNREGAE